MNEAVIASGILNLTYLAVGLIVARILLWYMNRSIGVRFGDDMWGQIKGGNMAVALYAGLRLIGLCLIVSTFIRAI